MVFSMTGFASHSVPFAAGSILMELKAVNHRYFDVQVRLPDELRSIENKLREKITAKVSRGKLECRISINFPKEQVHCLEIEQAVVGQLLTVSQQLQQLFPESLPISISELMHWPGVLKSNDESIEQVQSLCLEQIDSLLKDFNDSRAIEGDKLRVILTERVNAMENIIKAVQPKFPKMLESYMGRLNRRLQEAMVNPDEERIKQEITFFAQKADIDEELSRLGSHIHEVKRILKMGGKIGKRLDFLMQELNREANTVGAKSVSIDMTQASIELKVLIEQIREQVQNIE